jgi:hypothetical protein
MISSASRSCNPNIAPCKDTPSVTVLLVCLHLKGKVSNIIKTTDPIIRAVQTFVGVESDGDPRVITWKAIYAKLTGKAWADPEPATVDPIVRAVQTSVGVESDGDPREITWKAIYAKLTGKAWADPEPAPVPDIPGIESFPQGGCLDDPRGGGNRPAREVARRRIRNQSRVRMRYRR